MMEPLAEESRAAIFKLLLSAMSVILRTVGDRPMLTIAISLVHATTVIMEHRPEVNQVIIFKRQADVTLATQRMPGGPRILITIA